VQIGEQVGRYLIQAELGGGSTAYVYKGLDTQTNRTVAVKVLHTYLVKNSTIVERFRREAEVIAKLQHPHVVTMLDYYEDAEHFLYVMEYLDTYTVEDVLKKKGKLPAHLALPVVADLCDALVYAHSFKIIHRDIKPSNLFIARGKGVILSDFGLAKPLEDAPITAVGSKMMGTPHYMAPEQVTGGQTDERTDLYQAGLILYQLVTGGLPFQDKSHFKAIMMRIEREAEFSPEQQAQIPEAVRALCLKALRRSPAERYQNALEMRRAVADAQTATAAATPPEAAAPPAATAPPRA
jgi:serine/threonine protein kinase